jgi:gamma-glutamyltranspeptidase/glutathione hydrolase
VPGTVAGLWEAHLRLGSLPWADLVEPAASLARGFIVGERLVASFPPHIVEGLRRFPESAKLFLPRTDAGQPVPPRVGDLCSQADLARTLERIRDRGADGFYRGETAELIVEAMGRGRGIITPEDLTEYEVAWREPIRISYREHTVVSMPPSSSGGMTLSEICHILSCFPLHEFPWHGIQHIHLLSEAWRRAYADRNYYLADPDFVRIPLSNLTSQEYGRERAETISLERATPFSMVAPGAQPGGSKHADGAHTTHVSIVDARGGAVAITTTLNTWYGSKMVVPGAGFLMNNEMDDFTLEPGLPNAFGLVQGQVNAIEPRKRMLSAMTPTLVLAPDETLMVVLGSPGGATIITSVFQVISNLVDHGMQIAEAVYAPRVHHQHLPDRIQFEPGGLPGSITAGLDALGHVAVEADEPWGDVQAILVAPNGMLEGVSDPRRGGAALGL